MAQRSATARSKLHKISGGITKFYGQLTPAPSDGSPSISSRSTGSNSYSLGRAPQKSFLRNLLDNHSDKIRGNLEEKLKPLGAGQAVRRFPGDELPKVKKWEGGGRFSQPWDSLRRDPELWYPEGDTLIYLSSKNSRIRDDPYRAPSFRIPSHVVRQTGSPFLIASLSERWEGRPPTPASVTGSIPYSDDATTYSAPASPTFGHSAPSSLTSPSSVSQDLDGTVYELHFPAPPGGDKLQTAKHHLATRNFFALLLNRSLVGVTLGQTLHDLQDRMDLYLPPTNNNTMQIMKYLRAREFDDIRNSAENAAGMLAFAERNAIAGVWREAFVHCIGLLSTLEGSANYRDISPITHALIDRASLEVQVRIGKSDARLSTFDFTEMWPASSANPPAARLAFEKFQKFLSRHYSQRFGTWPPQYGRFSRMLYVQLQRDFAALYDYLVDRDVLWAQNDAGKTVLASPTKNYFSADDVDLPITQMMLAFDQKYGYPNIPHPFPLVPQRLTVARTPGKSGFFGAKKSNVQDDKMAALVYSEATNISSLLSANTANPLVEAFTRYEKSEKPSEIDPHDARKGRWVLIYGILQTLATVSVDAPELKWTEGVDYYLNAKLRDTPPWQPMQMDFESGLDETSQLRSHCWTVPQTWPARNAWGAGRQKHTEIQVQSPGSLSSGEDGDDEMEDVSREFEEELHLGERGMTGDSSSSVPRHRADSSNGSAMMVSNSRPTSSRPSSSPVQVRQGQSQPGSDIWPPMPNRDPPIAPQVPLAGTEPWGTPDLR